MAKADSLPKGRPSPADRTHTADDSGTRRTEILQTAASLIASSGLRTSLQEIADAAGILPGSLYHHFESKEAILIELIRRYQEDLNGIGRAALARLDEPDTRSPADKIVDLGKAIANCAVRHGAALQMSFYEGPGDDPELTRLTQQAPTPIQEAMLQTLRAGRWSGFIKPDIDLPTLADRICQTMLQVGLSVMRGNSPADQVAELLCRIILQGLATRPPTDSALDQSNAMVAAQEVIATWADDGDTDPSDKAAHVLAVARAEFGRKGYEVTTIRDIASAAGLGTGTVYRVIGSKDELLASIMESFGRKVEAGWVGVLRSNATPIEKLDALSWINVNALDRFSDEFRIQLAWMRQSPPNTPNPGWLYATRLRQMKTLLSEGIRSGEISIDAPSTTMLARCLIGLQWIPENILRAVGKRAALVHARDTVLRGVAVRAG